ncbi:MAG: YgaP-like transmembrane domain [Haloferacaceae archaeon]
MVERNVGGRDRLARAVLAVGLAALAAVALRSGRRSIGTVAAVCALALGFNAATCFCGLNRLLGVDTTEE